MGNMYSKVIAHAPFMGHTGYANHARDFFTALNELVPVSVISSTYDPSTDMNDKQLKMLDKGEIPEGSVHIVLEITNHQIFYANYKGPKIAYNVWESTKQPKEFFKRLLDYDQLWVPTEWQRRCSIEQGYPADRVKVVREGVDSEVFTTDVERKGKFKFLVVGRWEYRKSTQEILRAFKEEFPTEDFEVQLLVNNPFAVDGLGGTTERLKEYGLEDSRFTDLGFVEKSEYVRLLQTCDTFVSCSRSEGWNLPLLEAVCCGVVVIASECSGQMEYLEGLQGALMVPVLGETEPRDTYPPGSVFPGMWYEPDFGELRKKLRFAYEYARHPHNINLRNDALRDSLKIKSEFTWEKAAKCGLRLLEDLKKETREDSLFYIPGQENSVDLTLPHFGASSSIYKEIFVNKDYQHPCCRVEKGDVVVDCGANVGVFARYAETQGAKEVHCIEPEQGNCDALLKNFSPNKNISCCMAIAGTCGSGILHIHSNSGGHSLTENNINNTKTDKTQPVEVTTLEGFMVLSRLERINFLKIDTEGSELGIVLNTPVEVLEKVDKIVMEYHHMIYDFDVASRQSMLDRLKEAGFVCEVRWPMDGHLQLIYCWRPPQVDVNVHFIDGPFCELVGDGLEQYRVDFSDLSTGELVYSKVIQPNHWVRPSRLYFTKWLVSIFRVADGELIAQHEFDPTGKRIAVWFGSKSLGDTIAWLPYVEEFRRKHSCEICVATWWNKLFDKTYPEISFTEVGSSVENLYSTYTLGVFDGDLTKNRNDWRSVPLQQVSSDMLGISYTELRPDIVDLGGDASTEGDYICVAEFSTSRCKLWNRLNAWQELSDRLTAQGHKVISISKEPTGLGVNVVRLNGRKIEDTIATLKKAKLFIGVSSGLAWLAWSLKIPVILISGFTAEFCEFTTGVTRIINKEVCNGCCNDIKYSFDRGDWNWCPREKNFECTREISPELVMERIELLLKE